jgi:hypothetical protein
MKLRFRNNSIRLRVNRHEVEGLASGVTLEEQIHFPGDARIAYILESSGEETPDVSFSQGIIRVAAPQSKLKDWASSDAVGIYFELPTESAALRVAIEKDLECGDGAPEERDPDAFPRRAADPKGKNC